MLGLDYKFFPLTEQSLRLTAVLNSVLQQQYDLVIDGQSRR